VRLTNREVKGGSGGIPTFKRVCQFLVKNSMPEGGSNICIAERMLWGSQRVLAFKRLYSMCVQLRQKNQMGGDGRYCVLGEGGEQRIIRGLVGRDVGKGSETVGARKRSILLLKLGQCDVSYFGE